MVLKKEIMKTQNKELEKAAEYRHLLVHAIHECAANFPDIAANVIHLLMDFLVRLCCAPPDLHAQHSGLAVAHRPTNQSPHHVGLVCGSRRIPTHKVS